MKLYKILGYIRNSPLMYESIAQGLEQAQRWAGYMLKEDNCYKVEIMPVE